ncbi:MAG TPA: alpha/beta fold hydrolase [Polyangiaceae bacterium]|nr:alpha/beta fold hydrolase [Polyangiaceae bacterium]
MPTLRRADITLEYDVHGTGHPLLLLAPGGMRSARAFWQRAPFDPVREFSPQYRVISMDQRNAGGSRAPITAADGWHSYAEDQLALLDELGVERCHLLGGCIGGAFALSLIARAPERVSCAVLQQPIGYSGSNRQVFYELFDGWAAELKQTRSDIPEAALAPFRSHMYDADFVFSVSREVVATCPVPLLVLRGNDVYHPSSTSEEIVRLAPRAELIQDWKTADHLPAALSHVRRFLSEHSP